MFAVCTPCFSGYGTTVSSILQAIPLLHLQFFLHTITCTRRINDLFSSVLMDSSSSLFLWIWTSALFIWRRRESLLQREEDKKKKVVGINHSGFATPAHTVVLWQWKDWRDREADPPRCWAAWEKGDHICWKISDMVEVLGGKTLDRLLKVKPSTTEIRNRDMVWSEQDRGKITYLPSYFFKCFTKYNGVL